MVDKFPGIYRGPAGFESSQNSFNLIANGAIPIGSSVKLAAPGTGEEQPRVAVSTAGTDICVGVAVDGQYRGTYGGVDTSITPNPSNSANAAGQSVQVVMSGRVKVVVDGSTSSIALGDALSPTNTGTGYLKKATAGDYVVARAWQTSSAFGDIILAEVTLEGKVTLP
jgi:hypothetical protein